VVNKNKRTTTEKGGKEKTGRGGKEGKGEIRCREEEKFPESEQRKEEKSLA